MPQYQDKDIQSFYMHKDDAPSYMVVVPKHMIREELDGEGNIVSQYIHFKEPESRDLMKDMQCLCIMDGEPTGMVTIMNDFLSEGIYLTDPDPSGERDSFYIQEDEPHGCYVHMDIEGVFYYIRVPKSLAWNAAAAYLPSQYMSKYFPELVEAYGTRHLLWDYACNRVCNVDNAETIAVQEHTGDVYMRNGDGSEREGVKMEVTLELAHVPASHSRLHPTYIVIMRTDIAVYMLRELPDKDTFFDMEYVEAMMVDASQLLGFHIDNEEFDGLFMPGK